MPVNATSRCTCISFVDIGASLRQTWVPDGYRFWEHSLGIHFGQCGANKPKFTKALCEKRHLAKALPSVHRTNSFLSKPTCHSYLLPHPQLLCKFVNSVNSEAEINVLQIWHVRHMVNAYWFPPGRGLSCVRELRGVLFGFVARLVAAAWTQHLGKVQRKQEMKDNGRLEISQCGSFHSCHSCFKDFLSLVCCLLLDKVQNLLVESSSSAKLHVSKAVSGKYIPENPEVSMCASTYLFLMMKVLIN